MKYQVVISGFGGQGSVFLVKVLTICSGNRGLSCLGTENHGMSQRGGSVSCYTKIGDFYTPVIDNNQADLIIGLESNETLRNIHLAKKSAKIVVNADSTFPKVEQDISIIDAFARALKGDFPIQGLNVYMLGVVVGTDKNFPFSYDEVKTAIEQMNPKVAAQNIAILDLGIKDSKEL